LKKAPAKRPPFRQHLALLGLIACLTVALPAAATAQSQESVSPRAHHLFGSVETRNTVIDAFTKWTGVLERTAKYGLGDAPGMPCRLGATLKCRTEEWKEFIASLKGKDRMTQLDAVNRYINRSPYVTDLENWGVNDYWETLGEFIAKDGDCEDYAIAKYYSLKALGFDISEMRIVILEDENLHVPHAVLAVFSGSQTFILDNQIPEVVRDTSIVHYRPIYSINEQAWWFHRMPEVGFRRGLSAAASTR
jgi:predicted transglutaminase-like cysteine proteinase